MLYWVCSAMQPMLTWCHSIWCNGHMVMQKLYKINTKHCILLKKQYPWHHYTTCTIHNMFITSCINANKYLSQYTNTMHTLQHTTAAPYIHQHHKSFAWCISYIIYFSQHVCITPCKHCNIYASNIASHHAFMTSYA